MSETRKQHRAQVARKAVSALLAFIIALMSWNVTITQAFASELDSAPNEAAMDMPMQETTIESEGTMGIADAERQQIGRAHV